MLFGAQCCRKVCPIASIIARSPYPGREGLPVSAFISRDAYLPGGQTYGRKEQKVKRRKRMQDLK